MKCVEFTLEVTGDRVVASMEDGSKSNPADIRVSDLQRRTISLLEQRQSKVGLTRDESIILGWNLYEILFPGPVGGFFETKYEEVAKRKECLRVQLSFAENAGEVTRLPWEYLYFPGGIGGNTFFFSVEGSLVLSRFIGQGTARPTVIQAIDRPVRVVVVVSTPESLEPEDQEEVINALKALHDEHNANNLFDFRTVEGLRNLADVEDLVRGGDVDVLHFIGYGRYDQRATSGDISLEDANHDPVWFPNEDFASTLVRQQRGSSPRLVFLHLCNNESPWQGDLKATFAGLARPLVLSGIPAVVAMQYPMAPGAAVRFFKEFYDRLANGAPIDIAVQAARFKTAANTQDQTEYGRLLATPIFYMQSTEGDLVPPPTEGETGLAPDAQAGAVGRAGPVPTQWSLRESLLRDITTVPDVSEQDRAATLAFLNQAWTDDQARLETAIRLRFSEAISAGQLAILRRMLSTLRAEREVVSP